MVYNNSMDKINLNELFLVRENPFYKWYDVSNLHLFKSFKLLIFSKETNIAHLAGNDSFTLSFTVDENGAIDLRNPL